MAGSPGRRGRRARPSQPTGPRGVRPWLVAGLLTALVLGAAPWAAGKLLRARESNAVLRGARLAADLGCSGCHGPPGTTEIPNPGSRWGSVPRFGAGNVHMYLEEPAQIAEIVRLGAPRAWLEDPDVAARLGEQAIRMPAYGDLLSEDEVTDLDAWVRAVEGIGLPAGEDVAAGRDLAREHGCLGCHGPEGAGGVANPGAFGDVVPGFLGANYRDLVRGQDELEEWVLTGTSRRLERNPLVRWAWGRQKVAMPAYEGRLTRDEIAQIGAWIEASRRAFGG